MSGEAAHSQSQNPGDDRDDARVGSAVRGSCFVLLPSRPELLERLGEARGEREGVRPQGPREGHTAKQIRCLYVGTSKCAADQSPVLPAAALWSGTAGPRYRRRTALERVRLKDGRD